MASLLPGEAGLLLSLLFAYLQFSLGGLLKGSVTCIDCSPLYDLSGVGLAVNCSNVEISYALTNAKGQFQILISKSSPLPPDCSVNLLGGKTQLCGLKKSIISKIIAINSLNKSSNSSYALQTPLAFFTTCKKLIEQAKLEKRNIGTNYGGGAALGEEKSPNRGAPPAPAAADGIRLPPLIFVFPFFPIIGIP